MKERRHTSEKSEPHRDDLRGAGVPPAVFLPIGAALKIRRRRLPHCEAENATYFVTFRLADSLPKEVLKKIDSERKDILASAARLARELTPAERKRAEQLRARRVEKTLDLAAGECFFQNSQIAGIVVDALKKFDWKRYRLFAWCLMPNHVHALFQPIGNVALTDMLHSWKSFSAKAANRILGRSGEFWEREYYDRLIRSRDEFDRASRYVVGNPVKAGLKNWAWVWPGK